MKKIIGLVLMTFCIVLTTNAYNGDGISFNDGWLLHKGEAKGAENAQYQDKSWEKLNLPHDWAIYGPFDIKYNARCGGLPFCGTGWYRKHFKAKKSWDGKIVRIAFDGAMNDSYVWINGHFLGNRPYGYIGFEYDITKYLKP
ncbi:MAG: sugar-binding domain-containing protein, partial [Lentisphaeria bacterium]